MYKVNPEVIRKASVEKHFLMYHKTGRGKGGERSTRQGAKFGVTAMKTVIQN